MTKKKSFTKKNPSAFTMGLEESELVTENVFVKYV